MDRITRDQIETVANSINEISTTHFGKPIVEIVQTQGAMTSYGTRYTIRIAGTEPRVYDGNRAAYESLYAVLRTLWAVTE